MTRADIRPPRGARLTVAVVVVLLHVVVVAALVRAFAPGLTARVAEEVLSTFSVTEVTPPPKPPPPPPPRPDRAPGEAAPAGRKAVPREVTAPKPKLAIATAAAPTVASSGNANTAGAAESGTGAGAGGAGSGLGGGGSLAAPAVKIAGDINSARDYPRETREQRIGDHVIIALTVTVDGRVGGCRVVRPSAEPRTDAVTCRLATERFRFRPALDAAGRPVQSVYGWRQRWFYPDAKR